MYLSGQPGELDELVQLGAGIAPTTTITPGVATLPYRPQILVAAPEPAPAPSAPAKTTLAVVPAEVRQLDTVNPVLVTQATIAQTTTELAPEPTPAPEAAGVVSGFGAMLGKLDPRLAIAGAVVLAAVVYGASRSRGR